MKYIPIIFLLFLSTSMYPMDNSLFELFPELQYHTMLLNLKPSLKKNKKRKKPITPQTDTTPATKRIKVIKKRKTGFPCPICYKTLLSSQSFYNHLYGQHNEKEIKRDAGLIQKIAKIRPFKCSRRGCCKRFNSKVSLQIHEKKPAKAHTNKCLVKIGFSCPICPEALSSPIRLKYHLQAKHTAQDRDQHADIIKQRLKLKPFKCLHKDCRKTFRKAHDRDRHAKKHTSEQLLSP